MTMIVNIKITVLRFPFILEAPSILFMLYNDTVNHPLKLNNPFLKLYKIITAASDKQ